MSAPFTFTIPLRLSGSQNAREHWAVRAKRVKAEKAAVFYGWTIAIRQGHQPPPLPVVVTMTRIGKRKMDFDGVVGCLKATQDACADMLSVDDGDEERISWAYRQEIGKEYGVRVTVEARR